MTTHRRPKGVYERAGRICFEAYLVGDDAPLLYQEIVSAVEAGTYRSASALCAAAIREFLAARRMPATPRLRGDGASNPTGGQGACPLPVSGRLE